MAPPAFVSLEGSSILEGVPDGLLAALEAHYKGNYVPTSVFMGSTLDDRTNTGEPGCTCGLQGVLVLTPCPPPPPGS